MLKSPPISGSDQLYLSNLTKTIFRGYLDSYINVECRYLNDKCASVLQGGNSIDFFGLFWGLFWAIFGPFSGRVAKDHDRDQIF